MLEGLLLGCLVIVGFVALVAGLIVLPFLLIGLLFKLLIFAILLPLRLVGALFAGLFSVGAILFKVLFGLLVLFLGVVALAGGALLIPLVPVLLLFGTIAGAIWLFVRLLRPRPTPLRA